ncbi:MAG: hypothetical protein WC613_06175 [Candidatus Aenigmatarchaeota archaeon]
MKCKCGKKMEKVTVEIEGADNRAVSYQCPSGHVEFEKESSAKVVKELKMKESPLKIKQKIVKLSSNRLGFYFNQNIVRSLNLKAGEEVYISVPDKKRIILKFED